MRLVAFSSATLMAFIGSAMAVSCRDTPLNTICVDTTRTAIVIELRDSVTPAPIPVGTTLVVQDGAFIDSTIATLGAGIIDWPNQRPGTYSLTLRHPGYRTWLRSGVVLVPERCGVQQVRLIARLQPL